METLALTEEQARCGLAVMKAIAMADGDLSPKEVSLIEASGRALGLTIDVRALEHPSIDKVKRTLSTPLLRERAIQASILVAMMDGQARADEVRAIESLANALGVDEPRVNNLRQVANGQVKRLWIDLARRSFAKPIFEEALAKHGLGGVYRIVAPMIGLGKDPDLARRYGALGELPEDTLGYAYFRFIVDNELGFPGEGVVSEDGVWHDLSHVLGGYLTTKVEHEVSVVSFIAGYRREDPFFWLFTLALQFHLGIKVSPYSEGMLGHFDPERVLGALRRGMAMNKDLSVDWDYWPDLSLPLEEVRAKYGVPAQPTSS